MLDSNRHERFPENVQGDFYVQNQACIACGAPEAEAPDLIEHSRLEYGHCYFKKQPKTPEEINRAINAMTVSCIAGLRYGGKSEEILKRLYEIGEASLCDHIPIGNYKELIWNKVVFNFTGEIKTLSAIIAEQIVLTYANFDSKIINTKPLKRNYFEFIHRLEKLQKGTIYKCKLVFQEKYEMEFAPEKPGPYDLQRGTALMLNRILCKNQDIKEILWYDLDGKTYDETQLR